MPSLMIMIMDYGVGNVRSLAKAVETLGFTARISSAKADLDVADCVILPGQGAFAEAMYNLEARELADPIRDYVREGRKFLGICVGHQMLFDSSEENGTHAGLGLFRGHVASLAPTGVRVPHMGWNQLKIQQDPGLVFAGLEEAPFVYFANTYAVLAADPSVVSATTDYGLPFVSVIQGPHLLATQFHPEKSGRVGMTMLKNFLRSV